jgi:transposase
MADKSLTASGSFRNKPRRRFTTEYKRQVVRTLLASAESMAQVARDHDLNHNQLARWRQQYLQGQFNEALSRSATQALVPVTVAQPEPLPVPAKLSGVAPPPINVLELRLPKGTVVIKGALDGFLLRELIGALQ